MPTLLRDPCFVLESYAAPTFVRLARTGQPLTSSAHAARSLLACRSALGDQDCAQLGLLIDWRLSPPAATPDALEEAAMREALALGPEFARVAVLLLAAAPVEPGGATNLRVFRDEEAAIAYVSTS